MSRPKEHYAVLCDGYPVGISENNRLMRTYRSRERAQIAANEMAKNQPGRTFEAARIIFGVKTKEGK